ncbi:hypothetical protein HGRIS_004089 [Hohenbuehelia grisea]|uniref:Uncharacterized protein n=1 Tax=Hohenbuehelia grisea TaxID=104357 RepID=A0ABR3JHM6_9AGAR
MYCALFTGSDKTVVSVGTGSMEYHPGYLSIGNACIILFVEPTACCYAVYLFAIPKSNADMTTIRRLRKFKRQLYHASLSAVFQTVKPAMIKPVVRRCPDGHFRRVIFDFGPVSADYPEQVLLAGTVQGWCAKCTALPDQLDAGDIALPRSQAYTEELIEMFDPVRFGMNLLHQIIKGTFKDHLVTWIGQYLEITHGKARANIIMGDIDRWIAAIPAFPGLRRFRMGRFKQWTGDDSKALMKVYLPALRGYVPPEIIKTFNAFLDFCYLVRRTSFTPQILNQLDEVLASFHHYREAFRTTGVWCSIWCMHLDYESRHITAVKRPWRRSNRYNAIGQMLITNQRLDKLVALRASFISRGMLPASHDTPATHNDEDGDGGPVDEVVTGGGVGPLPEWSYPSDLGGLANHLGQAHFPLLVRRFLFDQLHPKARFDAEALPINALPSFGAPSTRFPLSPRYLLRPVTCPADVGCIENGSAAPHLGVARALAATALLFSRATVNRVFKA